MKLFFLKEHSLYKIFKTLEKVPENRTVHIFIDPEHAFFDNERWWVQIKELLEKKHITAFFITKTDKAKYFFSSLGLAVQHQEKHKILKIFRLVFNFFFNIKRFHLQVYAQKNYIFYVVFWFEVFFVFLILYLLYSIILPSARIKISPANQAENVIYNFRYYPITDLHYQKTSRYLSLPYQNQFLDYKYDLRTNVSNIKYIQHPSEWVVLLFNKTSKELSFLPDTKFSTEDGRMFVAKKEFSIPAWTEQNPWISSVSLRAMEVDEEWILMWTRGNLNKGTNLFIRNMKTSFHMQQVYGKAADVFSWWSLQTKWLITEKDIEILSGKLLEYVLQQKKNIVLSHFVDKDSVVLSFNDLIHVEIKNILIRTPIGSRTPIMDGSIIVRFVFPTVKRESIFELVHLYLQQRSTDKIKSLTIDKNSISFFKNLKAESGVFVVPTKVSVLQSYDFTTDINGILPDIKSRVVGLERDKAREIIVSYPEIAGAKIVISPPRYSTVSKLKSRIKMEVNGEVVKGN